MRNDKMPSVNLRKLYGLMVILMGGGLFAVLTARENHKKPSTARLHEARDAMEKVCRDIPAELPSIRKAQPQSFPDNTKKYLAYFGLDLENVRQTCGMLRTNEHQLFVHLLVPETEVKGTVVFTHGYLDHSALYSRFVRFLTDHNYAVVLWDLPGHGLSNGPTAVINDFRIYGELYEIILELSREKMPGPFISAGHSTGCSVILEHMRTRPASAAGVEAAVFVAPLLRSYAWHPSQIGRKLIQPFTSRLPRIDRRITHDDTFQRFADHGAPRRCSSVSLTWVKALAAWNRIIAEWDPPAEPPPLIIAQGTKDTVVAWKYNLEILTEKFPAAKVKKIEDAYHHLLNEQDEMRTETYDYILQAIEDRQHFCLSANTQPYMGLAQFFQAYTHLM